MRLPPLVRAELDSAGFTLVPLGVVQVAWHVFNSATALWAVGAGLRMARRGLHLQAVTLVIGVIAFFATVLIDAIRDALGRGWPYLGGAGAMVLAILLSAQLALDFREREMFLSRLLEDAMRIRDQLNTPLQTIRVGLDLLAKEGKVEPNRIARFRRAVDRLTKLGRDLQTERTSS